MQKKSMVSSIRSHLTHLSAEGGCAMTRRGSGNGGHHKHLVPLQERWRGKCDPCGQNRVLHRNPDGRNLCSACLHGRMGEHKPPPVYRSSQDMPYGAAGRAAARAELAREKRLQRRHQRPAPPKQSAGQQLQVQNSPTRSARQSSSTPPGKKVPHLVTPDLDRLLRRTVIEKSRLLWEQQQEKCQKQQPG